MPPFYGGASATSRPRADHGLFADPGFGPQRLTRQTSATIGPGFRMFFCDTFDFGLGWQHSMTGNYLIRDQTRFELRYRY